MHKNLIKVNILVALFEMHIRILTLKLSLKLPCAQVKPHKVSRMLISCEYAELHIWLIWKKWDLNVMRLCGYV